MKLPEPRRVCANIQIHEGGLILFGLGCYEEGEELTPACYFEPPLRSKEEKEELIEMVLKYSGSEDNEFFKQGITEMIGYCSKIFTESSLP